MQDCLFCMIAKGDIPSNKVYEDDTVLAFRDINPQAPTHILVIPTEQEGLADGFRVITNSGKAAGQTVPHLHFHILAGAEMAEKLI